MMASKSIDFNSAAVPVLDMAHVMETIELNRRIKEIVRKNRKKKVERLRGLTGKK